MAVSQFVDHVKLYFESGKGGAGAVSWRREKFVPRGGPDGGDGGDGGDVILEGDRQLWTLLDLKYRKFIKAEHGQPGMKRKRKGKSGKNVLLKVPLGVVVKDVETGKVLGEITAHGQQLTLLNGGKGGLGNWHFKSSTRQSPEYAQPGTPGESVTVVLELKTLADVGLVGFPNAGKSTLLAAVTAAKPKIANYPFTTLKPNLGIVKYRDHQSFVMADIPGIIQGAHVGKGLGHAFLRHIERNAVLLILLSAESEAIREEYHTLLDELKSYDPTLLHKQRIVAISKADVLSQEDRSALQPLAKELKATFISSVTGEGMTGLLDQLWSCLQEAEKEWEG